MKKLILKVFMFLSIAPMAFGNQVPWKDFESSVGIFLEKTSGKKTVCTGVLLNPTVILTAAHCAIDLKNAQATVDKEMIETTSRIEVKNWIVHPSYQGNDLNNSVDLSLMFLKEPMSGVSAFPTISNHAAYTTFERIGFGKRDGKNKRTYVTSFLNYQFGHYLSVRDSFGHPGDSGGPLFQRLNQELKLVGVHTGRGMSSNANLLSNSYVQLIGANEILWINENIKKDSLNSVH